MQSKLAISCLCVVQSELAISCLCVVQSELAKVLLSMGCVGMALDIYERLQLWEDAIACYQRLGKREKVFSILFYFFCLPVGEKVCVFGFKGSRPHKASSVQCVEELKEKYKKNIKNVLF